MKELTPHIQTQQHEERQQEQHYRILGKQIHVPGLTLFEYDSDTKILRRAEITKPKTEVVFPVKKAPEKRHDKSKGLLNPEYFINKHAQENERSVGQVLFKKGCVYFEALNQRSAEKKLVKLIQRGEL